MRWISDDAAADATDDNAHVSELPERGAGIGRTAAFTQPYGMLNAGSSAIQGEFGARSQRGV